MGPLPERQDIVAISRFAPRIGKGSQEFENVRHHVATLSPS
jgi:hypothetical protein